MLGNYRVAAQLVASRVVLSSTQLVSYTINKDKALGSELHPKSLWQYLLAPL
jgi:hypothetical protein